MSIEALAMAGADYLECGIRFELYEEDDKSSNAMMMMSEGGSGVALPRPSPAEKAVKGMKKNRLRSFSGCNSDLAEEQCRMKEKLVAWAKEVASLQVAAATLNLGCI
ncbi:hypothetical protein ACLOJK_013350 [Asimina triloba]